MTSRTVTEVVADELVAAGVTTGFGVVGEGNLAVVYELVHRHGLAWVPSRREDGGVAMADGYARRGRRLGFAAVTHGPALTNALTALVEARKAGTPLVVLTGEFPETARAQPQWLAQREVLASAGIDVVPVTSPEHAVARTREAVVRATDGRHPVMLSIRTDLFEQRVEDAAVLPAGATPAAPATPAEGDLDRVAELLAGAARPVIVAGSGVMSSGAAAETAVLAGRAGALLGTTLRANGLFAGQPWNVGVVGGFARPATERLVRNADLVLVVGAGLNHYTTDHGRAFGAATVVRVDLSPTPAEPTCQVALTMTGDARAVVIGLLDRLKPRADPGYRTSQTEAAPQVSAPPATASFGPVELSLLLDQHLQPDRAVCTDLGYFTSEVVINVAVESPDRFLFPVNFGSVGLGLATAIGAAHAAPDTLTLAALGDGGLAMSLQELETLARTKARVLVVVYDDGAYGVEYHALHDQGRDVALSMFDDVDFAAVARSLGIPAATARTPDEAAVAVQRLAAEPGPALLDVKIDGTVRTRWYDNLPRETPEEEHT